MTQEEMQKYWDACLIRQWRRVGTVGSVFTMFKSIVGHYPKSGELLRIPPMHRKVGIRVYVDCYLPKLNDLLWKVPPDKDVEILNKLTKSKYDNDKHPSTNGEKEMRNARQRLKRSEKKIDFKNETYENRNHDTDWGVVKSNKARRGMKRK